METYLMHHGILGQKWGIRRFQNADGSYTAAGKERRNNGEEGTPTEANKSVGNSQNISPDVDLHPGLTDEQRKTLLLAGAGAVAAATLIGVSVYNSKHEGKAKKVLDTMKDVTVPKMNLSSDENAAKDATAAILKEREAEKALNEYLKKGNDADPKVVWLLAENYDKAITAASDAVSKRENVKKFVSENKESILADPSLIKKYKGFLSNEDLSAASTRYTEENKYNSNLAAKAKQGAVWMGVISAYGTAAASLYKLGKFPNVPGSDNVGPDALKEAGQSGGKKK